MGSIIIFTPLLLLSLLNISVLISSIIMGYKIISLFGLTLSSSIYAFPISYMCGDIIAEIYGYRVSRAVIYSTFFCLLLFACIIQFQLNLQPVEYWQHQSEYQSVLGGTLRLTLAIIGSLILGDLINAYVLTKWKVLLRGRAYWLRSLGSTAIGEAVDTFIGFLIAFIGTMSVIQFFEIALSTYMVKMLWNMIYTVPASIIVFVIKNWLHVDVYDYSSVNNPYIMTAPNTN